VYDITVKIYPDEGFAIQYELDYVFVLHLTSSFNGSNLMFQICCVACSNFQTFDVANDVWVKY